MPAFVRRISLLALALLLLDFIPAVSAAERVLVVGEALEQSAQFRSALNDAGYQVESLDPRTPDSLATSAENRLIIIGSDSPLLPQWRNAISRFLNAGGNVIVVGAHNFDYAPRPVRPVTVQDFTDPASYQVVSTMLQMASAEHPRAEKVEGPHGTEALRLRTYLRGMGKTMVTFSAADTRAAERKVLTFQARGNAYADLLTIEVTDTSGKRWLNFVPLSPEWQQHSISFADFIPEGWSDADNAYPLLAPKDVDTIAMGIDPKTVWIEKPMELALASVALAEDEGGYYAPTAALQALRLPYLEKGIAAPNWLFDPFGTTQGVAANSRLVATTFAGAPKSADIAATSVWTCPPPFAEHPGVKMGTDTSRTPPYNMMAERRMRRIPIWQRASNDSERVGETVAELRINAAGPRAGGAVALFGVRPESLVTQAPLRDSLVQTVNDLLGSPKVLDAVMNTAPGAASDQASPVMRVVVQNPSDQPLSARVTVNLANGRVRGEAPVTINPRAVVSVAVPLDAVPVDFPFTRFEWQISLHSSRGEDLLTGTTDIERSLILALQHMVRAQAFFPDGRYSHHYFGDAYGVRAMLAYLDLLQREPDRLATYSDLWIEMRPEDMRKSADRWIDMTIRRQNEDGSFPMGYGEHTSSSNVADGGQIALAVGQMARYLSGEQREGCLQFCRRFVDWAETFYIDSEKSKALSESHPEQVQKGSIREGHYALGTYSLGRRHVSAPKWVLPDILGVQLLLTTEDPNPEYRQIAERNARFYLDAGYGAAGYYHAEAMVWTSLRLDDPALREQIHDSLRDTFLKARLEGNEGDMYDNGARGTLRALPLIYYREMFDDSETVRALLLKYVWAFATDDLSDSMLRLSEEHPKPQHGASISATKFAEFSAIWAAELLEPGCTLLPSDTARLTH